MSRLSPDAQVSKQVEVRVDEQFGPGLQTQTRPGAAGLLLSSQQGTCSALAQTAARLSFRSASRRRQAVSIKTTTSGMAFQFTPKSKGKMLLCDIAPSQQDRRI